jgi:2-oxoglutarate ferredoxin oxidoreductase subunit alpha
MDSIVVRLAGDSGDGVQLMGSQFIASTALSGKDFSTFPDYPAEIRAPVGTTFGVSAYQMNIGTSPITTAGDAPDVLVAFNPAALKVSLPILDSGALIIVNNDSFTARNLTKAGYENDPRETGSFQIVSVDISHLNLEAVKPYGLSKSDGGRCKNFWALGLLMWMFDRDLSPIEDRNGGARRGVAAIQCQHCRHAGRRVSRDHGCRSTITWPRSSG